MKGSSITQRNGVWHVTGNLDVHFNSADLVGQASGVVKLNFEALTGITSLGARKLRELLTACIGRGVEFQECPGVLVDMMNFVPGLFDVGEPVLEVVSVYAPYACGTCQTPPMQVLLETKDVVFEGVGVKLPPRHCPRCGKRMEIATDPHDYFLFKTDRA